MRGSYYLVCLLAGWVGVTDAATHEVFQIGVPNGDYHEFALAGNWPQYETKFPDDANFTVGISDPALDWPYILPGPLDGWAGSESHTFKIHFKIPRPEAGYYRLVIDFVSTHGDAPPELGIDVNGAGVIHVQLPKGDGDEALTDPGAGKHYTLDQMIPGTPFHAGENTVALTSESGSWALFDDVRLEGGVPAPAETVGLRATPLPFYRNTPDGLRRAVKITIQSLDWGRMPARLAWAAGGKSGSQELGVNFGDNDSLMTVPDAAEMEFTLEAGGKEIKLPMNFPPAKKWRLYIVPTTHTDIGYTDIQSRIKIRHANNGLAALQLLDEYPDFKWYSETFWQMNVLLELHPEVTDQVFGFLREKRWGLSADYANMLTGLCSSESLDRLTLDSRLLANRGGFDLNSDILDDVPSAVGSLPMVLAHSGIKYFIEGANNDRAPYAGEVPNPFFWEGADGSRVLADITTKPGYGAAGDLLPSVPGAMDRLPPYLERFQTNMDYPYDAILINGAYSDNHEVLDWLPKVVNEWNAEWAYPKMIFAQPEDFYGYIERNFSNDIPVLKTDFGDWWSDGAGSAAYETALSRRAEERAVTAEMLHSLASIMTGAEYPLTNFDGLWNNILLFNEHTWGAAGSINSPHSEQTLKQWDVKSGYARDADTESRSLLASGMRELAAMAPTADLVVFNPLAWSRNAVVTTTADIPAVMDIQSGQLLQSQALPEGGRCFVARDLPAIGYRCYRQSPEPGGLARRDAVRISGDCIENEFYRVTLNPKTGGIQSIYDKQLKRELVDRNSEYDLGELIYVTGGEGTSAIHSNLGALPRPHFEYHPQTGIKIESINGPVFGELDSEAEAEDFPRIMMRVRLYAGLRQLDLIYDLDKKETLSKEAVYLAFPFTPTPGRGGWWLDYPDEMTDPLVDEHASGCRDWYAVQRWLAISDGHDTVELSALDTPLFTIGKMTASTWPKELPVDRGHVFAYIMNNYWHTNYKAGQGGHFVLRYSLTSTAGAFSKRDAVVDGWDMYCPAVAAAGRENNDPLFKSAAASLVGVKPFGLPLTTIKEAEDGNGFIFRCCDYAGAGGKLRLTLPRPDDTAFRCNLVETDEGKVKGDSKTVVVGLTRFAPATVRVGFPPPPVQ